LRCTKDLEISQNVFSLPDLPAWHHHLDLIDDMPIIVSSGRIECIHKTRASLWLPSAIENRVKAGLVKAGLCELGGDIIENAVDPDHPFVDLICTVVIAKKAPNDPGSAIAAEWRRANNADPRSRTIPVLTTGHSLCEQGATVRAEVIVRQSLVPALIADITIIVGLCHDIA
jgi:hypothetical protein